MTDEELTSLYSEHKNLKICGDISGIAWQTIYSRLRKLGVKVVGDKARYGSDSDRLAAKGERLFKRYVPAAVDQNDLEFQAKVDFMVNGVSVDVKTSSAAMSNKGTKRTRFAFSLKKQALIADFFVCIGMDGEDEHFFLVPGEVARNYTTMSASLATRGKWWDYSIDPNDLSEFFSSIG